MDAEVIVAREGAVPQLVPNRPEKKNALDREMYEALISALAEARAGAGFRGMSGQWRGRETPQYRTGRLDFRRGAGSSEGACTAPAS